MSKKPTVRLVSLPSLGRRETLFTRFAEYLLPDERAQYQRFVFDPPRDEYLMSRALCRLALAEATGTAAMDFVFARNEHGKPYVTAPHTHIHFNLTGTRGLVAIAIADHALGLDAEFTPRSTNGALLADRFFSPREAAALRALPSAEQQRRFFDYWTLKEAYIKARGLGMAIPLASFSFTLDPIRLHDAPDQDRWHFAQHVFGDHLLSICSESRSVDWRYGLP